MRVSFVFDDGFIESCLKVAEIYEARGLSATYAVLVNHEGFMEDFPKGDMTLWNELVGRGHVVHPHGWDHSDLTKISYEEACSQIERCLAYFKEHLDGFEAKNSMYHLTYNRSTTEVENYLLDRVAAIRTTGLLGEVSDGCHEISELPRRCYQCFWHGPECCDAEVKQALEQAKEVKTDHFVTMLHGLDGEGWGPMSRGALESMLDQILEDSDMEYDSLRQGGGA